MLSRHLSTSVRYLLKNKTFSLINIFGISAGLTAFILIVLYVHFECSYDRFHEDADRIYRIVTKITLQGEVIGQEISTYDGIIKWLDDNDADVEDVTVINTFDSESTLIRVQKSATEVIPVSGYRGVYADQSLFNLFSFPLRSGEGALAPYSAVISQTWARAYFSDNAIGKTIQFTDDSQGSKLLTITGVMTDIPENSHLKFDIAINIPEADGKFWDFRGHTYVRLKDGADRSKIQDQLEVLAREKNGLKTNPDDYGQANTFILQPLTDIHLYSDLPDEFEPGGDAVLVYSLVLFAIVILIIVWVNYINLSTAAYAKRIQQMAIRRVIGSSKRDLVVQVLVESALLNVLGFAIALLFAQFMLSDFASFAGVSDRSFTISHPYAWGTALIFVIFSTLISGVYPALAVASVRPVTAMKGGGLKQTHFSLRSALVVLQFTVATTLTITTVSAYKQLRFMQGQDPGVNMEQMMIVKAYNFNKETWSDSTGGYVIDQAYAQTALLFSEELRRLAYVKNTASISHLPGQLPNWGTEFKVEDIDPSKAYNLKAIGVDYDFIPTLGLTILAGRNFSRNILSDRGNENKRAIIINETACKSLGFRTPGEAVSRHISTYWGADYEVIGVVKSFHQVSLKEELTPLYFILQPRALSFLAIDLHTSDIPAAIAGIRSVWSHHFPGYPFDYLFLDEYFDSQYRSEVKLSSVTGIFTALTIFIACMGLSGLSSYLVTQRTKEIGIRKVLGASVFDVISLFSADFAKLLLIANCIATPATYLGISVWLNNYAYKTPLAWWMFVLPVIVTTGIAVVTVTMQTMGVATRNPVKSLKHP